MQLGGGARQRAAAVDGVENLQAFQADLEHSDSSMLGGQIIRFLHCAARSIVRGIEERRGFKRK
jgi:hypothetical protein